MITKNQLALDALEQIRISGLTVNATPRELTSAIRRMDSMIAAWQKAGLCLSYNKSAGYSDIDFSQDSGLSDSEALAVVLNLAKTLSPSYGKGFDMLALGEAKEAYDNLFSVELTMREADVYQPVGQGNNIYGINYYFSYQSEDKNAPVNCSTVDMVVGEKGFVQSDFTRYLNEIEGDTIVSYTTEDGEGVEVLSDSIAENVITLDVRAKLEGYGKNTITITTSSGRVLPRAVNYDVKNV